MSVELFAHNRKAYDSAVSMLAETGKAAVIHPTGTGKSFIGFKLCAEHASQRVCWLSPSEYIFRTQVENLAAAGGKAPGNIVFITYARLARMEEEELRDICPAYIILDEFHRCGAEMWGAGVARLLSCCPDAAVLGLSATSIRYLDNQRDMAAELFEGNVASEMTLGEAIVRGILAAPKYVVSIYSCEKELRRYESRTRRVKNAAARAKAEKYLWALRRALEKADGLEDVFFRHMTDRTGKYLVFCANVKSMEELLSCCGTWFGKVDPAPHIYRAYADDPQMSEEFAAFKADDSDHLKLLFCIDMLNEGIHVDNLAGVILFRPTVSPIVYKQQIGRALTASGSREPVIFDVVNNFENLYSIGTVQAEIEQAACRCLPERERAAVLSRFRIIDEVRESRRLFDALNETLSAPWEEMFARARDYFQANGNLNVPKRYRTEEGYTLGAWITTQRRVRAGRQYGTLTPERIAKLDSIGMVWENRLEGAWDRGYEAARAYYLAKGDLLAEKEYVTPEGYPLGAWLSNQRAARGRGELDPQREERLNEIGMVWSKFDYLWERNFQAAEDYRRRYGDLNVPAGYKTETSFSLGQWIAAQRRRRRQGGLSGEQVRRLEALGMVWEPYSSQWETMYAAAKDYAMRHGSLEMPSDYRTAEGLNLGKWLHRQREAYREDWQGRDAGRFRRLEELGMVWEAEDPWETRYQLAKAYRAEHGDLNIPGSFVVQGIWLGKWLNEQKQVYWGRRPGKHLTGEQIARLESLSISWTPRNGRSTERKKDRTGAVLRESTGQ